MSNCKNGGRDALMPALRIELDLDDGRTLHRDLALNGCEVSAVRIGGSEFVERRTCDDVAIEGEWFECSECGAVKQLIHPNFCPKCGAEVTA